MKNNCVSMKKALAVLCLMAAASLSPVTGHAAQGVPMGKTMVMTQDDMGTHITWRHEGVTAKMVDWFWSNMEKCNLLWHPSQHEPLRWGKQPVQGNPIGSIHISPQTWNDGQRQDLYIRMEQLESLPPEVKKYIEHEHVIVVSAIGYGPEAMTDPKVWGYRIHQWTATDYGIEGKSSAIGMLKKESKEDGQIWAAHCAEEIGNWGVFLPQLYTLYLPVTNPQFNPYTDLSVEGKGVGAKYKFIK